MKSISFNTGYKEYAINDNANNTIRINMSDLNLPHRIKEVQDFFDNMAEKYKNDDRRMTSEELSDWDKQIREKINYAFGTDVCTPAFGNINCISPVEGGKMLFEAFFEVLMPVVEADMKAAAQAQAIHIEDKTNKYISAAQSAPVAPQIAPAITVNTAATPDISNLTQEQKDAMLIELLGQKK